MAGAGANGRWPRRLLLLVIGLVLWSSAAAEAPRRLVSLAPSLTELTCALGACETLVAVDRASTWPSELQALPRVGDLHRPDLERIVQLAPDLVLSTPYGGAGARLRALGIPVATVATDRYQDLFLAIRQLGELLQRQEAATALARRLRAEVAAVGERVAGLPTPRVYYEIDVTPYTVGGGSYVSSLVALAGGHNIAGELPEAYPRISPELVLRAEPEVIVLANGPHGVSAETVAARPGWAGMPAVRNGRVCALDQAAVDVLHRPGPRIGEALGVLVRCLHPALDAGSQGGG